MADDGSGAGWIEMYVRDLDQLFQPLDPSPFHVRELDERADAYITESARELPNQQVAGLIIYIDGPAIADDERAAIAAALRRHFARRAMRAQHRLRQHFREARASLVVSLPILAVAVGGGEFLSRMVDIQPLHEILGESLLIGGWVAMWRPIELFLYEWWPIRDEKRIFERLSDVEVRVVPYASAPGRADRARARQ